MTTVQLVVPTVPGFHVFEAPRAADIPETSVQFLQSLGRTDDHQNYRVKPPPQE